jgi:MFS family permease
MSSSSPSRPGRALASSLIGTVIEWYEFYIYGTAAALVFDQIFFPEFDPFVGTLLSLSTFAVAFVARPLGAAVFGHYGDRLGRKTLLVVSLTSMGSATLAIGLLPSFESIGIAAPIILVILRLIQGLSLGGEYGGAVLMSIEHTRQNRRGLSGGIINTGASLGLILATSVFGMVALLPEASFMAWGWRVPFLLSVILLVLGLFIRLRVAESPEFTAVQDANTVAKLPIRTAVTEHGKQILLMAIAYLPTGVIFYLVAVFSLSYGTKTLDLSRSTMLMIVCVINAIAVVGLIFFGWLSDRKDRRTIYQLGVAGMVVTPWIWFMLINTQSYPMIFLGFLILFVPFVASYGTLPAYFSQVFPPRIRYTGMSLGYSIGSVLGSGISPLVATALLGTENNWTSVAVFVTVLNLAALAATLGLREIKPNDAMHPQRTGDLDSVPIK